MACSRVDHLHNITDLQPERERLSARGKFLQLNKGPFVSAIEVTSKTVWHSKEKRKVPPVESAAVN